MATHSSVLAWRIPGMGEPCTEVGGACLAVMVVTLGEQWLAGLLSLLVWPPGRTRAVRLRAREEGEQ